MRHLLSCDDVSKICFFKLRFSLCLFCSSGFITVLAILFLSRIVPCLIARFPVANVGLQFFFLQVFINLISNTFFWCFVNKSSKFLAVLTISCPCFLVITLKTLIRVYNLIVTNINRSKYIFSKSRDDKYYFSLYIQIYFPMSIFKVIFYYKKLDKNVWNH